MRRFYMYYAIAVLCASATSLGAVASAGQQRASRSGGSLAIRLNSPSQFLGYDMTELLSDFDVFEPAPRRGTARSGLDGQSEDCLSKAVYYEARSESKDGQRAVAQVIINRVGRRGFAPSVCGVVYQGVQYERGCQFRFACDGSMFAPVEKRAWDAARSVAISALHGLPFAPVGNATFYHAVAVRPGWSNRFVLITRIGSHLFYRSARA